MILHILCFFFALIAVSLSNEQNTKIYSKCGEVIAQHQFIVQSPRYPEKYPPNIVCEYILKGYDVCQTEFHFQFLDFNLEKSTNCADRLQVGNQDVLCGFMTGVKKFKTEGSDLRLKFLSENIIPSRSSSRRFKLLITRLPCNENVNGTLVNIERKYTPGSGLPNCCATSYKSRRFYLASPGFPYSNRIETDCVYNIYRSNPNICRLRLHFNFFWAGLQQNGYCPSGYFEIDGKQICGCRSGLNIISKFDQFWDKIPKVLRFKNNGYPKSIFSGFAVEIIQDECPTKYSPSSEEKDGNSASFKSDKLPEFYYYNDQLSPVISSNFSNENLTEKIVTKRTEILDDNKRPDVKYYYYFFKAPNFNNDFPKTITRRDKEQRTYFETTSNDFLPPNGNDDLVCRGWGILQWTLLTQEVLWQKMAQCRNAQKVTPKCCEINNLKGCLVSPGYPFYYQGNLNICYRFQKLMGYCGVQLSFIDFDLESSQNCKKAALILYNKYRYCGNYLRNAYVTFDLSNQPFEEMRLSTGDYYCGRGFKLIYEQIPCETTPLSRPMTTTSSPSADVCGSDVISEIFTLNFPTTHQQCLFNIRKFNQDVCGLRLLFVNFDLRCGAEYVLVNGKGYCGSLSGQSVLVNFDKQDMVAIFYRRSTDITPASTRIVIKGQQVKENCDPFDLDIPAERRLRVYEEQVDNRTQKSI